MKARVITVIETQNAEGDGTSESPIRIVRRYWTVEGELLARVDPCVDQIEGAEQKSL